MPQCEDYPCCGHEPGDCPDEQGRFKCVCCGKRMQKGETSSICSTCRNNPRKMRQLLDEDY